MSPARYPLIKPVLTALMAVLLAIYYPSKAPWLVFALPFFIFALLLIPRKRNSLAIRSTLWLGILFCNFFLYTNTCFKGVNPPYKDLSKDLRVLRLTEVKGVKNGKLRLWANIIDSSGARLGVELFASDSNFIAQDWEVGDLLLMQLAAKRLKAAANPGQFNYAKYLALKGIHYQSFISECKFKLLKKGPFSFSNLARGLQSKLRDAYIKLRLKEEELGVAAALVFGDKSMLPENIREAYTAAGAMHVLAVSGLHVGIIYLIVLMALGLKNKARFKLWQLLLVVSILWLYAMITGFSPSVKRAATMFSFLALAKGIGRNGSSLNLLAASAIFLILLNPTIITEIGFQMSYLAVLGILFLYPMIETLWKPKQLLVKYIWQLSAISLAAQIATGMLSMYYFGQFPSYFLISNLLIIPLATVVVWLGALLNISILLFWPLAEVLANALEFLVLLLNQVVLFIQSLPLAVLKCFYIDWPSCLLYYLCIIFFIAYYYLENKGLRSGFQLSLFCFIIAIPIAERKSEILFFSHPYKDIIVETSANSCKVHTTLLDSKKIELCIANALREKAFYDYHILKIPKDRHQLIQSSKNKILLLSNIHRLNELGLPLNGKILFFKEAIWDVGCLNELAPKSIILSNSLGVGYKSWLQNQGLSKDIKLRFAKEDGFFIVD